MRIINIITLRNGLLESVHSYLIANDSEEAAKVTEAENDFSAAILSNATLDNPDTDIQDAIEDGSFDNHNGFEVLLTWSNTVN